MASTNIEKNKEQGVRIRLLREQLGLTRQDFEDQFGVSAHTLRALEDGKRSLSEKKAVLFSMIFNTLGKTISPQYILEGYVTEKTSSDQICTSQPLIENITLDETLQIKKEIDLLKENFNYLQFIMLKDDTMSPFFNKGDVVAGVKISNESLFSRYKGKICIIETKDGEKILRKVTDVNNNIVICSILNLTSKSNIDILQKFNATSISHATRHWRLSDTI